MWRPPLRELSWASLTSPNIFRSGYGLWVPYQAPKSTLYYAVLGRLFVLSDSPRHFHPFALWSRLRLYQLYRAVQWLCFPSDYRSSDSEADRVFFVKVNPNTAHRRIQVICICRVFLGVQSLESSILLSYNDNNIIWVWALKILGEIVDIAGGEGTCPGIVGPNSSGSFVHDLILRGA